MAKTTNKAKRNVKASGSVNKKGVRVASLKQKSTKKAAKSSFASKPAKTTRATSKAKAKAKKTTKSVKSTKVVVKSKNVKKTPEKAAKVSPKTAAKSKLKAKSSTKKELSKKKVSAKSAPAKKAAPATKVKKIATKPAVSPLSTTKNVPKATKQSSRKAINIKQTMPQKNKPVIQLPTSTTTLSTIMPVHVAGALEKPTRQKAPALKIVEKKSSREKKIILDIAQESINKPQTSSLLKKAKSSGIKLMFKTLHLTKGSHSEHPSQEGSEEIVKKKAIAPKKAVDLVNNESTSLTHVIAGGLEILPYQPEPDEEYMSERQKEHFRKILFAMKQQLMEDVDRTVTNMRDDDKNLSDFTDRATKEEEINLMLRTRNREGKLLKKIEAALDRIKQGDFGYCESCGVEIGIRRLEARPTATLCIDCKTLDEIKEKQRVS